MKHLKLYKSIGLIFLLCVLFLVGCGPEITSTKTSKVEATIIDTYHRSAYMSFVRSGKTNIPVRHPERSTITLSYDNGTFEIDCTTEQYEDFTNSLNCTITCTLVEDYYDDGTIKRSITLE